MKRGLHADPLVAAIDPGRVIQLTRDMVRIPSFCREERAVADWVADTMAAMGFDEVRQREVEPGRPNVYGVIHGTEPGVPSLLFNGHLDHNMVADGWTRDPFGAELEDGWIYGIGVANMKAGDMAMLAAVEAVRRAGVRPRGTLRVAFVVGELQGGLGTRAAIADGIRADRFVIAEPTELGLLTMHAGVVQVRIVVHGEMRHFTTLSGRKIHAIEKAVAVLQALGPSYEPIPPGGWLTFTPKPEYAGLPQLNVGVIRGGITPQVLTWRPSLVPDYCELVVDIRIVPGQTPETVQADLERLLERLQAADPDLQAEVAPVPDHGYFPPFEVPVDSPIVQDLARAHEEVFGTPPRMGALVPQKYAGADSAHLREAGMVGLLYGPGGRYLSLPDERVEADHVVKASQVFARLISRTWGLA